MWNTSFVIPTILIVAIFLSDFQTKPILPVRRNRAFRILLVLELVTTLANYFGCILDDNYLKFTVPTIFIANLIYFLAYNARNYIFLVYIRSMGRPDAGIKWGPHIRFYVVAYLLLDLMAIASAWTGWLYSVDYKGYHDGPFYWLIYDCGGIFFVLLMILEIYNYRKVYSRVELFALSCAVGFIGVGYTLSFCYPTLLVSDVFCLMAIVVLYLRFQDPDIFIDHGSGLFNERGYLQYMNEIFAMHTQIWVEGAVVTDYAKLRQIYGDSQVMKGIKEISDYHLKVMKDKTVFYLNGGRFLTVSEKPFTHSEYMNLIAEGMAAASQNSALLPATFISLSQDLKFNSPSIMMGCITEAFEVSRQPGRTQDVLIDEVLLNRLRHENAVSRALDTALYTNSVECWLQPLYNVDEQKVTGAEALARIRDKNGDLINPGEFIPMAEKDGRILAIGEQMFHKACTFLTEDTGAVQHVNVNLSPIQCITDKPTKRLQEIAEQIGVDPGKIILEITEEAMIDDNLLTKRMNKIATTGYHFSLDDFGSGMSGMNRLQNYPFMEVKLDIKMVRRFCQNPKEPVIREIVKNLRSIGCNVVAEGIETREMADIMTEIGCNYLQGFYFARPMPMEEFKNIYT